MVLLSVITMVVATILVLRFFGLLKEKLAGDRSPMVVSPNFFPKIHNTTWRFTANFIMLNALVFLATLRLNASFVFSENVLLHLLILLSVSAMLYLAFFIANKLSSNHRMRLKINFYLNLIIIAVALVVVLVGFNKIFHWFELYYVQNF